MQDNAMAEKKKAFWDGNEQPGLVSVEEISREKRTIEVPSFSKIRDLNSGITKLPPINMVYKVERHTNTRRFFEDFHNKNQVKDLEIVRTDADGVEFSRKLYPDCECVKISEPAYDAANPNYATISITVVCWDILDLD